MQLKEPSYESNYKRIDSYGRQQQESFHDSQEQIDYQDIEHLNRSSSVDRFIVPRDTIKAQEVADVGSGEQRQSKIHQVLNASAEGPDIKKNEEDELVINKNTN